MNALLVPSLLCCFALPSIAHCNSGERILLHSHYLCMIASSCACTLLFSFTLVYTIFLFCSLIMLQQQQQQLPEQVRVKEAAEKACSAALKCQRRLEHLGTCWGAPEALAQGLRPLKARIGIHTGRALV
eukprot:GEZU01014020.1.p1 GENE.GEZU01014020.1~~GEZU01014020.1.p1  ORF type:complete len:129 (-),score=3.09 GEZU01014020.1:79-465(-)